MLFALLFQLASWNRIMIVGNIIKLLAIITIVILIVIYIVKSSPKVKCKKCGNGIQHKDKYCSNCDAEIAEEGKEIVMEKDRKRVAIIGFSVAVVFLVAFSGVIIYANNSGYFKNLATGIYTEKREYYADNSNIWSMEFKSALTEGTLKNEIAVHGKRPDVLKINGHSESGTSTLVIEQGELVETVDISNTAGEIEYELTGFLDDDIKLSIEHTKLKKYYFYIEWE